MVALETSPVTGMAAGYGATNDNLAIIGGSSPDQLEGGAGDDLVLGAAGNDTLLGHDGNDYLLGGSGNSELSGGNGHDLLKANSGNDLLQGDDGNDTLLGGGGLDTLVGGDGDDLLAPGIETGETTLYGGAGDDIFNISATSLESFHPSGVDYVIADGEDGDHIVYNGYELGAGTWTALDVETVASGVTIYPSQDMDSVTGSIYQWNTDYSLSIILPDNQVILIPNWENGLFGITLGASGPGFPPAGTRPSDWPTTNIANDGTVGDFDYISERVTARTDLGPIDDPYVLFA